MIGTMSHQLLRHGSGNVGPFEIAGCRSPKVVELFFGKLTERKRPAIVVLLRARFEAHYPDIEVDLLPRQR